MLMTALFLVLPSCSKDDVNVTLTPSEEVVNAFQQKYPDVKNVKWEILVGAYEAEFIYSGTYSDAYSGAYPFTFRQLIKA